MIEENETSSSPSNETKESIKLPQWFKTFVNNVVEAWFNPKSFESKELYEKLGIRFYKKYLISGDLLANLVWKNLKTSTFIKGSSEKELEEYQKFTRTYELVHLTAWPLMTIFIVNDLLAGRLQEAALTSIFNIYVNVYSVMLQRYNRLRIYGAINKARNRRLMAESENNHAI